MQMGSSTSDVDDGAGGQPAPRAVDLHDTRRRIEVEEALVSLPGVLGARLVPGYDRPVDELHVLTTLDRAPKQAVRDLQTLLMARFAIATDHRVISVVQLDDGERGAPSGPRRVAVERVALGLAGAQVDAEVVLGREEEQLRGSATGPSSVAGQREAVASATLEALRPALGGSTRVDLEGCDVVPLRGRPVALALLRFRTGRGEHTVAGSALVRDAEPDAMARAVLDGLNRTLADLPR